MKPLFPKIKLKDEYCREHEHESKHISHDRLMDRHREISFFFFPPKKRKKEKKVVMVA
jgi:hypothetical protein